MKFPDDRSSTVKRALAAIGLCAVVLSGGCAGGDLGGSGGPKMFDLALQDAAPTTTRQRPRNVQLVVYEPTTVRTLDGDNVVVRLANSQMNYLDGARWSDRLPALLQGSLIEVLARSRQFRAVSNGRDKVDPDVSLSSTIEAFEVGLGGGGKAARVGLSVKLVDERSGSVLNSRVFNATAPLKGNAPGDHVAAIKHAFATVSTDLVNWTAGVKIKPRKDKLPAALARGTLQPEVDRDVGRVSRSSQNNERKL